jgi:hypothetical protein
VEIIGTFHTMYFDPAHMAHQQALDQHGAYDFGVRTIGLSG